MCHISRSYNKCGCLVDEGIDKCEEELWGDGCPKKRIISYWDEEFCPWCTEEATWRGEDSEVEDDDETDDETEDETEDEMEDEMEDETEAETEDDPDDPDYAPESDEDALETRLYQNS